MVSSIPAVSSSQILLPCGHRPELSSLAVAVRGHSSRSHLGHRFSMRIPPRLPYQTGGLDGGTGPGTLGAQRALDEWEGRGRRKDEQSTDHSQEASTHRWSPVSGLVSGGSLCPPAPTYPLGTHLCSWSWTQGAEAESWASMVRVSSLGSGGSPLPRSWP